MPRLDDPVFGPLRQRPISVFVGLAFGISWLTFMLRPILAPTDEVTPVLTWIVKSGPSLAGLTAAARFDGKAGLLDLGRGLVRWQVPVRVYAEAGGA